MPAITTYEFGYSWFVGYGLGVPMVVAAALGGVALWRGWWRWIPVLAGVVVLWAIAGLLVVNVLFGINRPLELPTPRFMASGSAWVLDAGAGSGRAAVGVLLARPNATVTGLDIYEGYWGIDDNSPERFMTNARIAGAAERAEARMGTCVRCPSRMRPSTPRSARLQSITSERLCTFWRGSGHT